MILKERVEAYAAELGRRGAVYREFDTNRTVGSFLAQPAVVCRRQMHHALCMCKDLLAFYESLDENQPPDVAVLELVTTFGRLQGLLWSLGVYSENELKEHLFEALEVRHEEGASVVDDARVDGHVDSGRESDEDPFHGSPSALEESSGEREEAREDGAPEDAPTALPDRDGERSD